MTNNIDTRPLVDALRFCIGASSYSLQVNVVDDVDDEGEQCSVCQEIAHTIAALVHYSYDEPHEPPSGDCQPCCLSCVFPFIDSIPWLNIDKTITVEVSRGATHRPF